MSHTYDNRQIDWVTVGKCQRCTDDILIEREVLKEYTKEDIEDISLCDYCEHICSKDD